MIAALVLALALGATDKVCVVKCAVDTRTAADRCSAACYFDNTQHGQALTCSRKCEAKRQEASKACRAQCGRTE
jgi:hypothetical protein